MCKPRRAGLFSRLVLGFMLVVTVMVMPSPTPGGTGIAQAQTQTGTILIVNSADSHDDGQCTVADCTLSEAINAANTLPGPNTIHFNIAGPTPHVITASTALPVISSPVTIDGLNGGACPLPAGGPPIELRSSPVGPPGIVLTLNAGSDGSRIRGVAVAGPATTGIAFVSAANVAITCNFVGLKADGTPAPLSGFGITGVGTNVTIGGASPGEGNVIANSAAGITLSTGSYSVIGNDIRQNGFGVFVTDPPASATIRGNTIHGNARDGVYVAFGTGIRITQNQIYSNGVEKRDAGIDLAVPGSFEFDGITPNDPGDTDAGVNNLQNFPVLSSAVTNGATTAVTGTLDTLPGVYTVELFDNAACNAFGNGEGENYIGTTSVTVGASNPTGAFGVAGLPALPAGRVITSTATASDGSTSEFSACLPVTRLGEPLPGAAPSAPQIKQGEDDTDKPKKETDEQRQQRERTNRGNKDDIYTEGNVVEVHQDEVPPYVVIGNKDGLVRINLLCGDQCPTIRVGDYLEVDGEKQHEQLFDATDVSVKRR